jgi:hypothetical protein
MYAQQFTTNPLVRSRHTPAPHDSTTTTSPQAPHNPTPFVTSGFPIQPDVKLKKLAFYDVLGTLLQPSTLMPASQARQQEGTYYFHLTPQQATDIAMNRDIRNPAKPEYLIQVQLRFCLLETTSEQEDCFPPNVQVKVNGKLCQLPVSFWRLVFWRGFFGDFLKTFVEFFRDSWRLFMGDFGDFFKDF